MKILEGYKSVSDKDNNLLYAANFRRLPENRIGHIKRAIYKAYTSYPSNQQNWRNYLFLIGNIVFRYQELRSTIRKSYDLSKFDEEIELNITGKIELANEVLNAANLILKSMPYPKISGFDPNTGTHNPEFVEIDITVDSKINAFPTTIELFWELFGVITENQVHVNDNRIYLLIHYLNFEGIEMEQYFNMIEPAAFASLVHRIYIDILNELTSHQTFHAFMPVANISDAVLHFKYNTLKVKHYSDAQIAYEIANSYINMHTNELFLYKSIKANLDREGNN